MNIKDRREELLNKTIYLDTSAAMHYKGFDTFVAKNEKTLLDSKKKIIVLKAVWLELVRKYNSKDWRKAEFANHAIVIINNHRDIFDIEGEELFQDEMENAFADKEILSRLILERTDTSILLITNDKKLSKDALGINKQLSCKGHKISTCFIDDNGNLLTGFSTDDEAEIETKVVVKTGDKKVKEPSERSWESIVLPIGTFATGFAIGKYYKLIYKQLLKKTKPVA